MYDRKAFYPRTVSLDPGPGQKLGIKNAFEPFTRNVPDWQIKRPLKLEYTGRIDRRRAVDKPKDKGPKHYTPRGKRSTWSKAQYTVYKEEKQHYREKEWKKRQTELRGLADELIEKDWRDGIFLDHGGNGLRSLLGTVPGLEDGQTPIEKDDKGLPVDPKYRPAAKPKTKASVTGDKAEGKAAAADAPTSESASAAAESSVVGDKPGSMVVVEASTSAAAPVSNTQTDQSGDPNDKQIEGGHSTDDPTPTSTGTKRKAPESGDDSESLATQQVEKRVKKAVKVIWPIPDETDEEEDTHDEYAFLAKRGWTTTHDLWPSKWRKQAAASVNDQKVAKTVSLYSVH